MENYYEVSNGEYLITTNPSLLSVDIIHHYLSEESLGKAHTKGGGGEINYQLVVLWFISTE